MILLYIILQISSRQDKSRSADEGEESRGRNHVVDGCGDEEGLLL
jgi:hypothetical protein